MRKFVIRVAAVVFAVALISSGLLRWKYGVWTPLESPRSIEYNDWRYAPAWDGDFDAMSRALASDGSSAPSLDDLEEADADGLPPWWTVYVESSQAAQRYPSTVYVRTLDGSLHPYGYKGMPPL